VTIRLLSQSKSVPKQFFASRHRTLAGQDQTRQDSGKLHLNGRIAHLQERPDRTVLNDSIPLFFIGRNQSGFWVARESEGRSGGLFLFRRSAARFARKKSLPAGCAIMLVEQPIELDLPNQGSRFAGPVATGMEIIRRYTPLVATLIGMAAQECRKLIAQILQARSSRRRNREAIERGLFRGEYKLVSKDDDDLPIP
jgi:hypothetical protein